MPAHRTPLRGGANKATWSDGNPLLGILAYPAIRGDAMTSLRNIKRKLETKALRRVRAPDDDAPRASPSHGIPSTVVTSSAGDEHAGRALDLHDRAVDPRRRYGNCSGCASVS